MSPKEEFSQRPFYLGSLNGIRSFKIRSVMRDTNPYLAGPVYDALLQPGVNTACCDAFERKIVNTLLGQVSTDGGIPSAPPVRLGLEPVVPPGPAEIHPPSPSARALQRMEQHLGFAYLADPVSDEVEEQLALDRLNEARAAHVGCQDCTCGYYAYFDRQHNPYYSPEIHVLAVVEGFGLMTVGSRGFRAQKLELLALIGPPKLLPPVLVDRYGVPVFRDVNVALMEFPLTVPDIEEEPDHG